MRNPILRALVPGAFLAAVALAAAPAHAQNKRRGNVIELAEITITGRIQKPIAAVEIARLDPKLSLGELHQPFLHRIAEVISKAPF